MNIYSCTSERQSYNYSDCVVDRSQGARVRTVAVVDDDADIDESTPALLASTLLTEEKACNAVILRFITGQLNDPSPITGPGYGDQLEEELGQNNTVEFTDRDYIHNIGFYNSLKRRMSYQTVYFMTESQAHKIPLGKATLSHRKVISNNPTEKVTGIVTISWGEAEVSEPISINRDTLKEPQELFDPSAMAFANVSGTAATISNNGGTITVEEDTPFEVKLDTSIQLGSVEILSGTLPTGVVAVINPAANDEVLISGSVATPVTRKVTLKVKNPCNVYTLVEVTVNIIAA